MIFYRVKLGVFSGWLRNSEEQRQKKWSGLVRESEYRVQDDSD